ncbi:bacterial surface protein 26-residue, partial [Enterococcus moraviensis ATCC BAA-383]
MIKKLLLVSFLVMMLVGGFSQAHAEELKGDEYDFIEYDVKTKKETVISFSDTLYEGMPEQLDANFPANLRLNRELGIIGEDDRIKVQNTSESPYSAVGQFEYPGHVGSGALIQKNLVLTAAHVVWSQQFLTDGKFVPARNGYDNKAFGEAKIEKIYILKKYKEAPTNETDFALVKLDRNIGEKTGWFGLTYQDKVGDTFVTSGYPASVNNQSDFCMYTATKSIDEKITYQMNGKEYEMKSWEKDQIFTLFDGTKGQSGSPIYDLNSRITGVFAAYVSSPVEKKTLYSMGSKISKEKFAMIHTILNQENANYVPVDTISIEPKKVTMGIEDTYKLEAVFSPTNATYQGVEWKSSSKYVSINEFGEVSVLFDMLGTVTITATSIDNGKTATAEVTIVPKRIPVDTLKIQPENVSLKVGQSEQLTATIVPENATINQMKWSSSDPSVVSISKDGMIKGIQVGEATITARTEDNKEAVSTIHVTEEDGRYGTVPWWWDEESETLTFGGGEFPDSHEPYLYQVENSKLLNGKKIKQITFTEPVKAAKYSSIVFEYLSSLKSINNLGLLDTSNVIAMDGMFYGASSLTELDVSNWDVSKVKKMGSMFSGARSLVSLDVSNWDTSNVEYMSGMFSNACNLLNLDVSNWDTSNVLDMSRMFYGVYKIKSLNVSNWNTSNMTNMGSIFEGARSLSDLDVSNWDTSNAEYMSGMFKGVANIKSLDVSNWNISNVKNLTGLFEKASGLMSLDISKWNTSNLTNMERIFSGASSLTSLNVSNWDTSNVTKMEGIFSGASSLTSLDVSNWDTSNVTKMDEIFKGASSLT